MTDTLADWLPVDVAAHAIGCSKRTIERLAHRSEIGKALRPQAGSPAVAVYDPVDVARIAAERQRRPAPVILSAVTDHGNGNGNGRGLAPVESGLTTHGISFSDDDPIRQLAAAFQRFLLSPPSPPSPPVSGTVAETLYVSVKEAAAILGLPQVDVRVLIHDGDLDCRRTGRGGIRIRRKDLEAL